MAKFNIFIKYRLKDMSYQNFQTYNGSLYGTPEYKGIEYDWEVPDNMVVASPGGVSTTHHHYTKGMYGEGASHWDIYGGEALRYPYGEHGGIYSVGHNAPQKMHEYAMQPFDVMYTQNQSTGHIDNFTPMDMSTGTTELDKIFGGSPTPKPTPKSKKSPTVEFISPPDTNDVSESKEIRHLKNIIKFPNPWFIFFVILIAYIALSMWANAGQSFLFDKFHGGVKPGYKWLTLYAILFTLLTFLITQIFGIPLINIELDEF